MDGPRIFISYRWEDTKAETDNLTYRLGVLFGPDQVFQDNETIPYGDRITITAKSGVSSCDVVVAVIGPKWSEVTDLRTGRRRLEDPADMVRQEIAIALKRRIPIIPFLIRGASMPKEHELPEELLTFNDYKGIKLSDWDYHVAQLAERLHRALLESDPAMRLAGDAHFVEASRLYQIAQVEASQGRLGPAREKLEGSVRLNEELGNIVGEIQALCELGRVEQAMRDRKSARRRFDAALRIAQDRGFAEGEAAAFEALGLLAIESKTVEGLCLLAVGFVIRRAISSPWTSAAWSGLTQTALRAKVDQNKFGRILIRAETAYRTGRTKDLIARSF